LTDEKQKTARSIKFHSSTSNRISFPVNAPNTERLNPLESTRRSIKYVIGARNEATVSFTDPRIQQVLDAFDDMSWMTAMMDGPKKTRAVHIKYRENVLRGLLEIRKALEQSADTQISKSIASLRTKHDLNNIRWIITVAGASLQKIHQALETINQEDGLQHLIDPLFSEARKIAEQKLVPAQKAVDAARQDGEKYMVCYQEVGIHFLDLLVLFESELDQITVELNAAIKIYNYISVINKTS